MQNIEVPKSIKGKLSKDEAIIGKISSGGADYYATDERLLRFKSVSDYQALKYPQISITFTKYGIGTRIGQIFIILLGLYFIAIGIASFIDPDLSAPFGAKLLFFVMGIGAITVALVLGYAHYQIAAPGFDKNELKRWRIQRYRWGSGNADEFAKLVKERSDNA